MAQLGKESTCKAEDLGSIPGLGRSPRAGKGYEKATHSSILGLSWVNNLHVKQETWVQSLGQEDPLEKGKVTHSSILGLPLWLSWVKNPHAKQKTWVRSLGWEDPLEKGKGMKRLPTPVFWPGEFHGLYSPWAAKDHTRLSDFHLPGT